MRHNAKTTDMSNTVKYTDKDYSSPYANGIAHLLPITLPFVQDLNRGEYTFKVEDAEYKLIRKDYSITLRNSFGKEYQQKQQGWIIVLVEGEDTYKIISKFENIHESKMTAVRSANSSIKDSIYRSADKVKHDTYEYKDFLEDLESRTDAEKVEVLQRQIKGMADGLNQSDALAYAYGYEADHGAMGTSYYPSEYKDQVESKRRRIYVR